MAAAFGVKELPLGFSNPGADSLRVVWAAVRAALACAGLNALTRNALGKPLQKTFVYGLHTDCPHLLHTLPQTAWY